MECFWILTRKLVVDGKFLDLHWRGPIVDGKTLDFCQGAKSK